ARVGLVEARDQVEERRLAGAVGPDQADDLALAHVERDVVDRDDPAEPSRHVLDREQGHGAALYGASRGESKYRCYSSSAGVVAGRLAAKRSQTDTPRGPGTAVVAGRWQAKRSQTYTAGSPWT